MATGEFVGAASGALTGAKMGSVFGPVGTGVGAVVGGLAGLFGSKSSKSSAPAYKPLDISKIIEDARTNAASNYANSFSLERQYNPGTAALRNTTNIALQNLADGRTPGLQAQKSILDDLSSPAVSALGTNPLLAESSARILQNLRLGGTLGADVQAQAVKAALEKGGAAGISGSGAARGLVARDLGLTSLGLENQRIQAAQTAGATQAQLGLQADALRLQDLLGRTGAINGIAGQDISRTGLLSQLVDARALPESGLNPGSIASLYVADNNARNQVNVNSAAIAQAQKNSNLNALLGFGSTVAGGGFDKTLGSLAGLFGGSKGNGSNLDVLLSNVEGP